MSLVHCHKAKVIGRGQFPIDMLRYDSCHPATQMDSAHITQTFDWDRDAVELVEVIVIRYSASRLPGWTHKRWASFGWTLGELA